MIETLTTLAIITGLLAVIFGIAAFLGLLLIAFISGLTGDPGEYLEDPKENLSGRG